MSVFRDSNDKEWRVSLDAFTLADVQKDTGVDLADVSAGGWAKLDGDAGAVVRVLAVVCRDEIKAAGMDSRTFARAMRGEAIDRGRAALMVEGADFFPPKQWSAMLSNFRKRRAMDRQAEPARMMAQSPEMMTMMTAFLNLPPDMQAKLIDARGDTSSLDLAEASEFASGLGDTPSSLPTDSPASAESPAAA